MNQKNSKKQRQLFRREVKRKIQVVKDMIRPQPKYMPTWLWKKLLYFIFVIK